MDAPLAGRGRAPEPEVLLLRAAAEVLRLPHKVLVTSLIFMHRFTWRVEMSAVDTCQNLRSSPYRLVCACLFVAAKVEEVRLTASDLINMVRCLLRPETWQQAAAAIPALAAAAGAPPLSPPGPAGPLSGEAYYGAKSTLLRDEQALLRVLRFDVAVVPPHVVLLNLCRSLGCPQPLAQLAVCLLNDLLTHTDVPAESPPPLMAAAALHLAAMLRGLPASQHGARIQSTSWWVGLGLALEEVEAVCQRVLDAIGPRGVPGVPPPPRPPDRPPL
eukprot:jgi/Tetstr1/447995/TSEL_035297.t1